VSNLPQRPSSVAPVSSPRASMLHCLRNSSSCHWRPPSWRHSTAERTAASRLLRTFSTMAGCCRCCGLPLTITRGRRVDRVEAYSSASRAVTWFEPWPKCSTWRWVARMPCCSWSSSSGRPERLRSSRITVIAMRVTAMSSLLSSSCDTRLRRPSRTLAMLPYTPTTEGASMRNTLAMLASIAVSSQRPWLANCCTSALVQQLANQGRCDETAMDASIASVFRIDAPSVVGVYGNIASVRLGLRNLVSQLDESSEDMAVTRMAMTVMRLERSLSGRPELLAKLQQGIRATQRQVEHFGQGSDQVTARLAELYASTLSTLRPRVMVNGNPQHLQQPA